MQRCSTYIKEPIDIYSKCIIYCHFQSKAILYVPVIDLISKSLYRHNWLRFVLPISSHVTILLGRFSIMLLFAFMAQVCMAQNM